MVEVPILPHPSQLYGKSFSIVLKSNESSEESCTMDVRGLSIDGKKVSGWNEGNRQDTKYIHIYLYIYESVGPEVPVLPGPRKNMFKLRETPGNHLPSLLLSQTTRLSTSSLAELSEITPEPDTSSK